MKNPDELVQYYIINKDLNMSVGKVATQVAHVATDIAVYECDDNKFYHWHKDGQKKIILKAKESILRELVEKGFDYITDFGLTEIPEGSLTCVGLGVMTRAEAEPYIKRLQLL